MDFFFGKKKTYKKEDEGTFDFSRGLWIGDKMKFIEGRLSEIKVEKDDPIRKMPYSVYDKYFLCESFKQVAHKTFKRDMNVDYIYNIYPRSPNDWNLFCDEIYDILLPIQNEVYTPEQREHFKIYQSISHEILVIALENARKNNYGVDKCNADKFLIGRYDVVYDTEENRKNESRNGLLYESFDWLRGNDIKDIDDCLSNSEMVIIELNVGMYLQCSEGDMNDEKNKSCFLIGYKNNGHACALIFYPKAGLYTIVDPNGLFASEIFINSSKKSIESMLQRDEVKSLSHCKAFILFPNENLGFDLQAELEDPTTAEEDDSSAEKMCLIGFNGICQTVTPLALYTTIKMNFTHPLIVGGAITTLIKNKKLDRAKLLLGFMSTISKKLPDNWSEVDSFSLKNLLFKRDDKIDLTKLYERPAVSMLENRFRQFKKDQKFVSAQKALVAAQEDVDRLRVKQDEFESAKARLATAQSIFESAQSNRLKLGFAADAARQDVTRLRVFKNEFESAEARLAIALHAFESEKALNDSFVPQVVPQLVSQVLPQVLPQLVPQEVPQEVPQVVQQVPVPPKRFYSPRRRRAPLKTYSRSRRSTSGQNRVRKNYSRSRNVRKTRSKRK